MTRVLNVISDTNIGGAGRVLLNYLQSADRSQFEIMVALPRGSLLVPELEKLNTEIHELDGLADRSYSREDVRLLRVLIRQLKPDIVHTHGALSGRIAGRQEGCRVIYTRHSAFPVSAKLRYPPGRWVNKLVNEHYADHIIAVSPAAAQNLTDAGISPRKITTLMNGVTPVERLPEESCRQLREQWGLKEDDFAVGILARLEHYKGHLDILEALHLLTGEGRRVKLLIAGSGAFEEDIRRRTEELNLQDQVVFLGFLNDVAGFLSVLDLQLNASYGTETSSLSILEGFSMGLPAVVSDYGGNPWLVDEGRNGMLFKTRDSGALAACIRHLMDSPEELAAMGEGARQVFEERFTGQIFARNVEDVYRMVMHKR